MNEALKLESPTWTTKEIADELHIHRDTVRQNAKELFPDKDWGQGKTVRFTEAEAQWITERIKANHSTSEATSEVTSEVSTKLSNQIALAKAFDNLESFSEDDCMQAAALGMKALERMMTVLKSERDQAKIELDQSQEWATLQKYCKENGYSTSRTMLGQLSKQLGKLGYERQKIFSAEYENGLWSYRISDLDKFFGDYEV